MSTIVYTSVKATQKTYGSYENYTQLADICIQSVFGFSYLVSGLTSNHKKLIITCYVLTFPTKQNLIILLYFQDILRNAVFR